MEVFRGDTGVLRKALLDVGFYVEGEWIFSDTYRNKNRRLKLWHAGNVAKNAAKREKLVAELKKQFGPRFVSAGLYVTQSPYARGPQSFVVHLRPVGFTGPVTLASKFDEDKYNNALKELARQTVIMVREGNGDDNTLQDYMGEVIYQLENAILDEYNS